MLYTNCYNFQKSGAITIGSTGATQWKQITWSIKTKWRREEEEFQSW